jgi:tRNA threonylcarbamoyladenosine biosynthesis protein TsaB
MIVLALDSSADTASVAVLRDDEPLAERSWRMSRPTGRGGPQGGLLGIADATLADARVALAAVELIAVATGPGSFNGIRAGIAVAEGLALALGVPAVGVPTLDALAYQHVGRAGVVCAVLPAGRGEYYGASYTGTWTDWRRRGDYAVATPADLLGALPPGALLCGHVAEEVVRLAAERGLACAPAFASLARASFVGALARARLRDPAFDAHASLQPVYLRRPGITRPSHPLTAATKSEPSGAQA